jgi:polar amino acid transport system ATP-binding protein
MVDGELVEDRPAHDFFHQPRHERARQFLSRHA